MPKDQAGARPLGVVSRHPADWFSEQFYTVGWFEEDPIVGAGEMWIAFSVFNHDSNGRVMRVYGATAVSDGGGGLGCTYVSGATGSQRDTAKNIRPDYGAPNVTISSQNQQTAIGAPNPFPITSVFGILGAPGFDSNTFVSPFPLFIIPVGYSLFASTNQSSEIGGLHLWFQLSNL